MQKNIIVILISIIVLIQIFSGCLEENNSDNEIPIIIITYPSDADIVSDLVMISGTAYDPDDNDIVKVEVMIDDSEWNLAEGTEKWSFDWRTYTINDGTHTIKVRCWDGHSFSNIEEINVNVNNQDKADAKAHKWAVFIAVANFAEENESKLGNGGLYLAEDMAEYFIQNLGYPASHISILFDDGWIRKDNGYGEKIESLQERSHDYDLIYEGATKRNVEFTLSKVVKEANAYDDSEVFIWIFGHGFGDDSDTLTGGKLFENSAVFLWDDLLSDHQLGELLYDLKSDKTCVIVDACFSGGFSDRTILDFPTVFLLRSSVPSNGRVVISGASKFRLGYASTNYGPLFTQLWFEGIKTKDADGFKSGLFETGRKTNLNRYKDGKVSVEEAFYYARYILRTDEALEEYKTCQPQINDQYPRRGEIGSSKGLILG